MEESQKVLRRRKQIEEKLALADSFRGAIGDLQALLELQKEGEEVAAT